MSINRGMNKEDVVNIYNEVLLMHLKDEVMPFAATWMDLEIVILSEESQRRRNIIWHPLYVESEKKWYKWAYKPERTHRLREWTYGCQGKGCREGIFREFGINMYTLLYLKWITNKDLLYSTWDFAQCYLAAWLGGEVGGEWAHIYVWLSSFAGYMKLSQHC